MNGLGQWVSVAFTTQNTQLKARKKISSQGKSILSTKELPSGSGESAAVHFVQTNLVSFGNGTKVSDNDSAVVRTVETLSVVGSDVPTPTQEKETRSSGGIPSR